MAHENPKTPDVLTAVDVIEYVYPRPNSNKPDGDTSTTSKTPQIPEVPTAEDIIKRIAKRRADHKKKQDAVIKRMVIIVLNKLIELLSRVAETAEVKTEFCWDKLDGLLECFEFRKEISERMNAAGYDVNFEVQDIPMPHWSKNASELHLVISVKPKMRQLN